VLADAFLNFDDYHSGLVIRLPIEDGQVDELKLLDRKEDFLVNVPGG
jgi:hypothetical protein